MQTRIEKYKIYRQEILNDGLMFDKLANESSIIKDFTARINDLNPKILNNISKDSSIAKLISVDTKKYDDVENLREFSELIEEHKLNSIEDQIKEFKLANPFNSILDEKGHISLKWLLEDKNFLEIKDAESSLIALSNTWTSFQLISKEQLNKLDNLIKNKEISEQFKKYQVLQLDEATIHTKPFKKLYMVSLTVALILLAIMTILLVLKIIY